MRLAHLSDLHALDLNGIRWTRFINKRATGLVNLLGRRRDAHPLWLLDRLIDAVIDAAPDHVVITGDVSNLALESEFEAMRERLERLGGPERVSLIPGNHDVYTRGAASSRRFENYFSAWMWPDAPADDHHYPWLKLPHPELAIVGFSSAVPRAPFVATGVVSDAQLERFRAFASEGMFSNRFGVALVHHNLHRRRWHKQLLHGLRRREPFLGTLAEGGVRLVLHGHTHYAHRFESHGLQIVGCGSSTWNSHDPEHMARFNIYTIEGGTLRDITVHRHDHNIGGFAPMPAA
jgi:3',5'-cyclic AMP phosphodiesterase CpdA